MSKRSLFSLIFLIGGALLGGCGLFANRPQTGNPVQLWGLPVKQPATQDAMATATPTPFRPVNAKPTDTQKSGPTPTRMSIPPTATVTPSTYFEGGVDRIPQPDGQINILLLGSDYRVGAGFRTDTILLITLNPHTGKGSMVSFPRDLYLTIPGKNQQRINTAMQSGGFELMQDTFAFNFGIRPQYYVMTDFQGFEGIVDTLGGVEVNAAKALSDWCDLPSGKKGWCTIKQGENLLNGEMALWYARSRGSSNDFERGKRSQESIRAFSDKLISLDALTKAPALYEQVKGSVETNIDISTVVSLLPLASQLPKDGNFRQYAIGPNEVSVWIPASGAYLLLPRDNSIQLLLEEALDLE